MRNSTSMPHLRFLHRISALAALALIVPASSLARDDFQFWTQAQMRVFDGERLDGFIGTEVRFTDDASRFSYWVINPRAVYQINPDLQSALGYYYAESRPSNRPSVHQQRGQFELNPRWNFEGGWRLSNRNRIELIWVEGNRRMQSRLRHRFELSMPFTGLPNARRFFVSDEFYFSLNREKITENRLVPAGVSFDLGSGKTLDVSLMLRSRRVGDSWEHPVVLSTAFRF
jgi:hypothetical protein